MRLTTKTINSTDEDVKLHARYWKPNGDAAPCGLVCISHGFSEHLPIYDEVASKLVSKRLLVFGHDHRGHGESDGKRAYIDDVSQYAFDIIIHCQVREFVASSLFMFLFCW